MYSKILFGAEAKWFGSGLKVTIPTNDVDKASFIS